MKNELICLEDPLRNETPYAGWLRRSASTGEAMLASHTFALWRARFLDLHYEITPHELRASAG
jgi:hypothetical protein